MPYPKAGEIMSYKNGNYCAFYVSEPFSEKGLGAHASKDFVYYNTLRMWKGGWQYFPIYRFS